MSSKRSMDLKVKPGRRFKKGGLYFLWPPQDPVGPDCARGLVAASKRDPSTGRFSKSMSLIPGTIVLYLKRAKGLNVRVLMGQTELQISELWIRDKAKKLTSYMSGEIS